MDKNVTPTPWRVSESHFVDAKTDKGFTQEVAYCGDCAEGERAANARHIVKCVNSHDRLVEALREAVETIEDQYDTIWGMAGYGQKPPCKDSVKARALLAELDTKGEE